MMLFDSNIFFASLGNVVPSPEPVKTTVSPTDIITSKKPVIVKPVTEDDAGRSEYPPLGKLSLNFNFGAMYKIVPLHKTYQIPKFATLYLVFN